MMHPYFVATILVGSVAVAYGAYIIYKEISGEPILIEEHIFESNTTTSALCRISHEPSN